MKIMMVGATGKYAGLVLPELKKRGATVRALVRNEEGARAAQELGADETAIGDLEDPASLSAAAAGTEAVFHINPAFAPNEAELGLAMVKAAQDAGVNKFVFSGVIHPSLSKLPNHAAKLPVEQAISESGMIFTILQPTLFMQTLEICWAEVIGEGKLSLPYSKQMRVCYVDYRDVAEAAAIALTSDKLDYGTYELCAPGMINRIELALLMTKILGTAVEAVEPTFDEWADQAQMAAGPQRDGLKQMYADFDEGGLPGGNSIVLEAVLGREPRTLDQFVEELATRESAVA
ncbi:MAG TPA: NmrA family NAD(P)-binding protein [Terracidiphilus sp.]|jgi:uncharacterized protein YbjT (DUF2867 family)|nr:NmrA family NAD(P)-binding protein [Terracidiphilus sp.]